PFRVLSSSIVCTRRGVVGRCRSSAARASFRCQSATGRFVFLTLWYPLKIALGSTSSKPTGTYAATPAHLDPAAARGGTAAPRTGRGGGRGGPFGRPRAAGAQPGLGARLAHAVRRRGGAVYHHDGAGW